MKYALNMGMLYRLSDDEWISVLLEISDGTEVHRALEHFGEYLGDAENITDWKPESAKYCLETT